MKNKNSSWQKSLMLGSAVFLFAYGLVSSVPVMIDYARNLSHRPETTAQSKPTNKIGKTNIEKQPSHGYAFPDKIKSSNLEKKVDDYSSLQPLKSIEKNKINYSSFDTDDFESMGQFVGQDYEEFKKKIENLINNCDMIGAINFAGDIDKKQVEFIIKNALDEISPEQLNFCIEGQSLARGGLIHGDLSLFNRTIRAMYNYDLDLLNIYINAIDEKLCISVESSSRYFMNIMINDPEFDEITAKKYIHLYATLYNPGFDEKENFLRLITNYNLKYDKNISLGDIAREIILPVDEIMSYYLDFDKDYESAFLFVDDMVYGSFDASIYTSEKFSLLEKALVESKDEYFAYAIIESAMRAEALEIRSKLKNGNLGIEDYCETVERLISIENEFKYRNFESPIEQEFLVQKREDCNSFWSERDEDIVLLNNNIY
ncbi:hypothetical protein J4468_02275 [Candidatus Woesearchaeota archaeon]|nr:hypothetical protein [Candidatus Woesearchaeota archaeon]